MRNLIIALLLVAAPAAAQPVMCTTNGPVTTCRYPDGTVTVCTTNAGVTYCR
jgi:hypothetical protein